MALQDSKRLTYNKIANSLGFDYVLDSTQGQGVIVANGTDLMEEVKKELGF